MTSTLISAFFTYTLITAMTPGPNNILALNSVTSHGFRRSTRVLAGMGVGFLIIMLLCAALTLSLVNLSPKMTQWLSIIGAAYIVWLAWRIAMSAPSGAQSCHPPVSFWASCGLQFVNVKIILYGITALSTFVLPYTRDVTWILGVSLLLALIGILGNFCWALAGHVFQRLFQRHGRRLNWVLAALLLYCAVRMFI
ncbi:cysteine/O-acetylserine transporter [Kluyvera sp. STS39-E]|uniref:cysteine/O-acetylserine transporter n=1 Tax=Kluyvera sp. STS39-E TaxID=3234748 RepID=UPI0034C5D935